MRLRINKLNANQLNALATLFGAIAGITRVLDQEHWMDHRLAATIGGIALVLLGVVANQPAGSRPTTEQLEEKNLRNITDSSSDRKDT